MFVQTDNASLVEKRPVSNKVSLDPVKCSNLSVSGLYELSTNESKPPSWIYEQEGSTNYAKHAHSYAVLWSFSVRFVFFCGKLLAIFVLEMGFYVNFPSYLVLFQYSRRFSILSSFIRTFHDQVDQKCTGG